jgi:hypothetical protein
VSRSGSVTVEPGSRLPRDRRMRMALAAVVIAGLIPLLWPGDVPFINDEPQLIASAVKANREGQLASVGLLGTYGFSYGPAPTWVYQALTPITRDLVGIATLHILLMSAATAGAICWLGQSLRLWMWFAPVPLLSPYYWFYARVLWDNPFLLPLGALALAGYAAFLASDSSAGLRVSVAAMLTVPLVHLMGISLVAPLAAHMVIVRRRALWAHRYSLGAIAVAALWLAWPYWTYLAGPRPAAPSAGPAIAGWLFPLFAGRLLSARELAYFYGPGPVGGRVFGMTAAISAIGYALVWCGFVVAIALMVRASRHREWTARTHVAAISVGSLLCQAVVHGITAKFEHPHYHNGTWISSVMLAWFAVDFLATGPKAARWAATSVTAALAASLLLAVGTLAVRLHRSQGTRDTYGPTLANQQQVARALARYPPDTDVQVHVAMWERFPHTLAILRELNARPRAMLARRTIELRYASQDPASGAIEMVVR